NFMIDYIDLALTYGGFTSLDKVYLEKKLDGLSKQQRLDFITPPPSVINAYFAEIYQKQGPEAATDYYFDLSKALGLFPKHLSGKSFGFAYLNDQEEASVFSEVKEVITPQLLLEIAQIFPQYKVYRDRSGIRMAKIDFDETESQNITPETSLLGNVLQLKKDIIKITSF
ncbi:hypothetical protein, partial [Ralstonia pseudosolanacearum]|uniref:hypothetical protein n=1 Tax=Ralstonia pseudosolanacearum TaxID=1310165 RepID=UPI003CF9EB3E